MMNYLTKILNNLSYQEQGNVASDRKIASNGPRPKNRRRV